MENNTKIKPLLDINDAMFINHVLCHHKFVHKITTIITSLYFFVIHLM